MDQPATPDAPLVRGRSRPRRTPRTANEVRLRRRRVLVYALLAGSVVLLVNALVGENGYLAALRVRHDSETIAGSVAHLQRENAEYVARIHALQNDPAALEDAARRVLDMVRPGETVVVLRDVAPDPAKPPQ